MHYSKLILPLVVGAMLLAGCDRTPPPSNTQPSAAPGANEGVSLTEVKEKAQEAVDTAAQYLRQARDEYRQDAERELQRLSERVAEARRQLEQAAEEARPELAQRVNELREKADEARRRFERLRESGGEAWERARQDLEAAVGELRNALDEAATATQPTTAPAATQPAPWEK